MSKQRDTQPVPYRAVAKALGLTVEEVIAAETTGLEKCREWCHQRGLDLDDLLPVDTLGDNSYDGSAYRE